MGTRPTPIVVCGEMAPHAPDALAAGAVDVIGELDALADRHRSTPARSSAAPAGRLAGAGHHPSAQPAARPRPGRHRRRQRATRARCPYFEGSRGVLVPTAPRLPVRVIVIGASTGGPPALAAILAELPADLNVPLLVVQHMADGFVEGLARWLDDCRRCLS